MVKISALMVKEFALILLLCVVFISCAPSQRPVIGIFTQDTE